MNNTSQSPGTVTAPHNGQTQVARKSEDRGWVYIVDDDEAVLTGLALLARSCGWRCRTFSSATEFLSAAPPENHACLLLDLNMPVMSGVDLLRVLKGRGSPLPVIVMTGKRDSTMLAQAEAAAPKAVLLKPFQSEAFETAVSEALGSGAC